MTHLRHLHLIAFLGGMVAVQGCFNSESSPTSASSDPALDEEAIQSVIFDEEGELTTTDVRYFDDGSDGPALAPINTVRWRRELLHVDRTVTISIHKPSGEVPTADVTVEADATGLLHLLVNEGDVLRRLTKDFDDSGVRSLFFERSRRSDRELDTRPHRGWKLVALSGVSIESAGTTREIRSVHVQSRDVDETITNVTDLVRVGQIVTIAPNSLVVLTVDTGDETDQVFLHRRHARHRMELVSNDDGTFTGSFETGARVGPRHFAIDVLSQGTLYDDEERYDNVVWGIPYRVSADPRDRE